MNHLTTLANKYLTDKGTLEYGHGYTETYEELFKDWQDKPIRLFEIGICDPRFPGASLKMWTEYFPNAFILGMDINPEATEFRKNKVHIWIGDQNDSINLETMIHVCDGEFDIIIDDGSHVGEHILTSFKTLWKYVNPGGYYIIEDLHSIYANAEVTILNLIQFIKKQRLDVDISHLHGNKLIVIKNPLIKGVFFISKVSFL